MTILQADSAVAAPALPHAASRPSPMGYLQQRTKPVRGVAATGGLLLALAVAALAAVDLTFPNAAHMIAKWLPERPGTLLLPAGALSCVVITTAAWRAASRAIGRGRLADNLTIAAAVMATAVSATGMWQFFDEFIPTTPLALRVPLFAFLEMAAVAQAVRARDVIRTALARGADRAEAAKAARIDRAGMWAVTGLSAILASMAATSIAEAAFRFSTPMAVAWMWSAHCPQMQTCSRSAPAARGSRSSGGMAWPRSWSTSDWLSEMGDLPVMPKSRGELPPSL